MNEIKHTPGPWHWDDTVWGYDPEQQAPWLVDGNDDRILSGTIECNEANARLIAAAPELLLSLMPFANGNWTSELAEKARDAIYKATGV